LQKKNETERPRCDEEGDYDDENSWRLFELFLHAAFSGSIAELCGVEKPLFCHGGARPERSGKGNNRQTQRYGKQGAPSAQGRHSSSWFEHVPCREIHVGEKQSAMQTPGSVPLKGIETVQVGYA